MNNELVINIDYKDTYFPLTLFGRKITQFPLRLGFDLRESNITTKIYQKFQEEKRVSFVYEVICRGTYLSSSIQFSTSFIDSYQ